MSMQISGQGRKRTVYQYEALPVLRYIFWRRDNCMTHRCNWEVLQPQLTRMPRTLGIRCFHPCCSLLYDWLFRISESHVHKQHNIVKTLKFGGFGWIWVKYIAIEWSSILGAILVSGSQKGSSGKSNDRPFRYSLFRHWQFVFVWSICMCQ